MDKPNLLLGQRVRYLRRTRDFTQAKLAETIGVSVNYISQIETGGASPTFEMLVKLANGLEVSLKELFDFQQPHNRNDKR